MNAEKINARFVQLNEMEQKTQGEITQKQNELVQKQAELHAIQGAKQDCQFWISQVGGEAIAVAPVVEGKKGKAKAAKKTPKRGSASALKNNPEKQENENG